MSETNMPAAEANEILETKNYELAFHVLPTVAEGEVADVVAAVTSAITKIGGTLGDTEAPKRIDLAYEVEKHLEGKIRKFRSAYFGWVRFAATGASIHELEEAIESNQSILRHMILKLSKHEEAMPFYYHEALDTPMVEDVEVAETSTPAEPVVAADAKPAENDTMEESAPVASDDEDASKA